MTEPTNALAPFDGKQVVRTTIAVTNAGDGLSEALAIEPREMHHGETHYVVMETTVAKVQHTPLKDAPDLLVRGHTLKAGTATIVDAEAVKAMIAAQAVKNDLARQAAQRARDEAAGKVALSADGVDLEQRPGSPEEVVARAADAERAALDAATRAGIPTAPPPDPEHTDPDGFIDPALGGKPTLSAITGGRATKPAKGKAAAGAKPPAKTPAAKTPAKAPAKRPSRK